MKLKLFFFGFFCAAVLSGAEIQKDPALLFEADFNGYSVTANYSKGDPKSSTFTNPSLQLRMWPGIKEQGNALALEKTEQCAYPIKDNFDPRPRYGFVMDLSPELETRRKNLSMVFYRLSERVYDACLQIYLA